MDLGALNYWKSDEKAQVVDLVLFQLNVRTVVIGNDPSGKRTVILLLPSITTFSRRASNQNQSRAEMLYFFSSLIIVCLAVEIVLNSSRREKEKAQWEVDTYESALCVELINRRSASFLFTCADRTRRISSIRVVCSCMIPLNPGPPGH